MNAPAFDADPDPGLSPEMIERFNHLESQVTHLEHLVEELNGVVIEQGRELARMKKLLQRQGTTLETIEMERIKATGTKPPHYQ